ncbi:chromobox protein homolog 3 [Manduca sexta]|uniref:Chromo domain-containing protein n=1 Tax=Manduca sexta TaxID=7130 RepID=A0A921ZSS7_MANSE|nr:chromobox protein homolog 3 [Manduca sexta]KAG6462713.1 hypothetical protein O3G_MSEX013421 [Manduca sexta]
MRKVSKNRTDDDVISSTNGSLMNEDQTDTERNTDSNEKNNSVGNDSLDQNDDDSSDISKETKRGRPSKGKSKKRKSGKEKHVVEEEYEVEKIVDSKKIKGKLHYLIRWKGYSADSDTWEPENTLSCPELINKFNEEKENSKNKESKPTKKAIKRKAKKGKDNQPASKRPKTEWDGKDDENAEYEVERIMEVHHKKNGKREFLIHWKGWSSKFDSWEPESNLNCPELIKKFMDKVSNARSMDSRNLRVAPEATNRFTLQDPTTGRRLSKRRGQRQRVRYDNAE